MRAASEGEASSARARYRLIGRETCGKDSRGAEVVPDRVHGGAGRLAGWPAGQLGELPCAPGHAVASHLRLLSVSRVSGAGGGSCWRLWSCVGAGCGNEGQVFECGAKAWRLWSCVGAGRGNEGQVFECGAKAWRLWSCVGAGRGNEGQLFGVRRESLALVAAWLLCRVACCPGVRHERCRCLTRRGSTASRSRMPGATRPRRAPAAPTRRRAARTSARGLRGRARCSSRAARRRR